MRNDFCRSKQKAREVGFKERSKYFIVFCSETAEHGSPCRYCKTYNVFKKIAFLDNGKSVDGKVRMQQEPVRACVRVRTYLHRHLCAQDVGTEALIVTTDLEIEA